MLRFGQMVCIMASQGSAVNTIINWLDDFGLEEASKLLKEFEQTNSVKDKAIAQQKCHIHQETITHYCISCDSNICSECVLTSHSRDTHDAIKLDDVAEEMRTRRGKMLEQLECAIAKSNRTKELWEEKKDFLAQNRDNTRKEAQEDCIKLIESAEKKKQAILIQINNKEISDINRLMKERKEIQILETDLQHLLKKGKESPENSMQELQKIRKFTEEIADIEIKMKKQEDIAKKKTVDIMYRKTCNDGTFGVMTLST